MTANFQKERAQFSKVLMETMFQVKPGETVAITADSGSDKKTVEALETAIQNAGGKSLIMWIPKADYDGQSGMKFWPSEALTAALCQVDIWIDAQSISTLYSDIWETAMAKNKKLRYLIIAETEIESLIRTFLSFDIQLLKELLDKIIKMLINSKKVHITSKNGTNVSYEIDVNYAFDLDDGDFSKPIFGTAPGYVNIVPKTGSMNGNIVFDGLMMADVSNGNHVEFLMKDGIITKVIGNKEADKFKEFLDSFNDPNMYKISHNMFGFNPGVRQLSGNIVEDERVWGGVNFGFGHTSAIDMPPYGQEAKSHFDGMVEKVSIILDDVPIVYKGEVCHEELMPLAVKLIT